MAIRRAARQSNPDYMARKMDARLEALEEDIRGVYEDASIDMQRKFDAFRERFEEDNDRKREQVELGELSQAEYNTWLQGQIFRSMQYESTVESLTDVLVNSDIAAMAVLNGELPYVLSESYNFTQALGFASAAAQGMSVGTFQIYNAQTVQTIIRDNPDLLPVVDIPEDRRWNRTHINREITQGLVQGESMDSIASRLQRVTDMDNNAAIRNARTAVTGAENLGRTESARFIRSQGVPIDEVWSATYDARTRDEHLLLDGTKKNEEGYYGENVLPRNMWVRYPGDPSGIGMMIYNCRCREQVVLQGIDHSKDEELYEQFMRDNYPEDWAAVQAHDSAPRGNRASRNEERQQALDRQARLREDNPIQSAPAYDGRYSKYHLDENTDFVQLYADGNRRFNLKTQAIYDAAKNGDIEVSLAVYADSNVYKNYYGMDYNQSATFEAGRYHRAIEAIASGDFETAQDILNRLMEEIHQDSNVSETMKRLIKPKKK